MFLGVVVTNFCFSLQKNENMAKFIKLHSADKEKTEIFLNVDGIAYIESVKEEALIHLMNPINNGNLVLPQVVESYDEIKEKIKEFIISF